MKINSKKDLEILDQKIQNELGIDIKSYRNPEVIQNIGDLLVFPVYAINWIVRPVILFLIFYFIGFFTIELFHIQYLIYGLVGLVLFVLSGFCVGLVYLTLKAKLDIKGILNYTLDILESIVSDLNQVNSTITNENKIAVLALLFQGVTHFITIPTITDVLSQKIPFVGGFFKGFIYRVLTYFGNKMDFEKEAIESEKLEKEQGGNIIEAYLKLIELSKKSTNYILNIAFNIALTPLFIISLFALFLLFGFIYLIH